MTIPYPNIDPIALSIGPFDIKWYGISYLLSFIIGWYLIKKYNKSPQIMSDKEIDDGIFWLMMGVIIGGRLGHIIFYQPQTIYNNPIEIFAIWKGGMSFHGGMLGVIAASFIFCFRKKIQFFLFTDLIVCVVPIGLFFGRIANFINGEVFGRTTNVPWAMVFPQGGPVGRHPSQLYEAFLEGIILFAILYIIRRAIPARSYPGMLSGIFLIGYGVLRSLAEIFRSPDGYADFFFFILTTGQLLSLPMVVIGALIIYRSIKRAFPL